MLPTKDLVCFRCVCKSWCGLTTDPDFTKKHFEITDSSSDCAHKLIVLPQFQLFTNQAVVGPNFLNNHSILGRVVDVDYTCFGKDVKIDERKAKWTSKGDYLKTIGQRDGMACILELCKGSYNILVWDPTKDYSVVWVLATIPDWMMIRLYECQLSKGYLKMLSLKKGIWEMAEATMPFKYHFPLALGSVFFDGRLYWAAKISGRGNVLVYFRLAGKNELIREKEFSRGVDIDKHGSEFRPGIFRGGLCWVEYGVMEIYVYESKKDDDEIVKLDMHFSCKIPVPYRVCNLRKVLGLTRSGDVLMVEGQNSELVVYNPKKNVFKKLANLDIPRMCLWHMSPFVESLISPGKAVEEEMQNKKRKRE